MRKIGVLGAILIIGVICLVLANGNIALETWVNRPTPGPAQLTLTGEAGALKRTVEAQKGSANATTVAGVLVGIQAESTARAAEGTAQAIRAVQTNEAFQWQSETQAVQIVQTAEASREAAQATAAVESTARAWGIQKEAWTATAISENTAATRTAEAAIATGTAQAQATASVVSATAEALLVAQAGRETQLAFEEKTGAATATAVTRQMDIDNKALTGKAWSLFWLAAAVAVLSLAGVVVWKLVKQKTDITVIHPAPNGDTPLVYSNGRLTDMDRSPYPVVEIKAPPMLPLDSQMQLAAGDQAVDKTRALPRVVNVQPALPAQASGFTVIGPDNTPPAHLLPDGAAFDAINGDWKVTDEK